jgi:hypothetical protein
MTCAYALRAQALEPPPTLPMRRPGRQEVRHLPINMVGDGAQGHARAPEAIADGRRRLLRLPDEGFGIDLPILRNLNGWALDRHHTPPPAHPLVADVVDERRGAGEHRVGIGDRLRGVGVLPVGLLLVERHERCRCTGCRPAGRASPPGRLQRREDLREELRSVLEE